MIDNIKRFLFGSHPASTLSEPSVSEQFDVYFALTPGVSKSTKSWHVSYRQYEGVITGRYSGFLTEFVEDRVSETLLFKSDLAGVSIEFDDSPGWGSPEITELYMGCTCGAWSRYEDRPKEKQIPCGHIVVCAAIQNMAPPNLVREMPVA